jgi:hypothetical protein
VQTATRKEMRRKEQIPTAGLTLEIETGASAFFFGYFSASEQEQKNEQQARRTNVP